MGIPDEEIAQVRAATDIVALISEHTLLKKVGRRWSGLCPFHTEKTPSFSVNAEDGMYYCFGCQQSGDAISFVRAMDHLDFVDAVRLLADRAGVTLHEDQEAGRDHQRRSELLDAMERAVQWYDERLLKAPDAGPARDYLRSLGYDGEVVRRFRLGWAPDDWDALAKSLKLSVKVLSDSGLGFINRRGRPQDFFRGRVLFPICDPSGRPVAMGGRILPPRPGQPLPDRPEPKYKNSQESPIYSKRRTLYALNWAKQGIITQGEVVVCEGYTDVIGCFESGVPWAVATCGTALAEEHLRSCATSGSASCWPTTPTAPDRTRPLGSMSGSANTKSTLSWPTSQVGAIRATWLAATLRDWPAPSRRRGPSCNSGSIACCPRATSPRRRAGPGRPNTRWLPWPSTPTTWSVINT